MRKKLNKSIYKKILLIFIIIYIMYILLLQQRSLSSYKNEQKYYTEQINQQVEYRNSLTSMKDNVNSPEYIEEIAREKLDMFLPNERIYVDIGK